MEQLFVLGNCVWAVAFNFNSMVEPSTGTEFDKFQQLWAAEYDQKHRKKMPDWHSYFAIRRLGSRTRSTRQ